MRKIHRNCSIILAIIVGVCALFFRLDYKNLASEGLTLSSIVLAVYVAAMIGLINTDLSNKMAKTPVSPKSEYTQLGQLSIYFKKASFYATATLIISSIVLLLPNSFAAIRIFSVIYYILSIVGLIVYSLNIMFLIIIMRFMLNRQIWNE